MHHMKVLLFHDPCRIACKQQQCYIDIERAASLQFILMMPTHLFGVQGEPMTLGHVSNLVTTPSSFSSVSMSFVCSVPL
jgi:hypothetical protein